MAAISMNCGSSPVRYSLEDVAPGCERVWVVLVQLVAATEDDLVIWQTKLSAAGKSCLVQDFLVAALVVIDKVAVGHECQVLAVAMMQMWRSHYLVCDEVGQERSTWTAIADHGR